MAGQCTCICTCHTIYGQPAKTDKGNRSMVLPEEGSRHVTLWRSMVLSGEGTLSLLQYITLQILLSSTHMHTTHTPCTHKCSHTVQLKGGRVTCKKILFFIYMWISCWACCFFLAVVLWVKTLSKTANYHSHYSFSVAVDLG